MTYEDNEGNMEGCLGTGPTVFDELEKQYPIVSESMKAVLKAQFELFAKKHLDYGLGNIAVGTQLRTQKEIELALTGLWFRISDKVNRWKNIMTTPGGYDDVKNESILDTFQDIANYAMIAQIVARHNWREWTV